MNNTNVNTSRPQRDLSQKRKQNAGFLKKKKKSVPLISETFDYWQNELGIKKKLKGKKRRKKEPDSAVWC